MGEDSPWEIGIGTTNLKDPDVQQLTQIIRVTGFSFTPIHNFLPQIVKNINGGQNIKQRFLSLANANPDWTDGNLYGEGVGEVFKIVDPEAPTQIQNLQQTRPSILDPITLQNSGVQRSSPIASIATPPRR